MKTSGFVAEPAIDIEKTCPLEAALGDDITYDITITNNGNEDLENIVTDTVNGVLPTTSRTSSSTRWHPPHRTRRGTCTRRMRTTGPARTR